MDFQGATIPSLGGETAWTIPSREGGAETAWTIPSLGGGRSADGLDHIYIYIYIYVGGKYRTDNPLAVLYILKYT